MQQKKHGITTRSLFVILPLLVILNKAVNGQTLPAGFSITQIGAPWTLPEGVAFNKDGTKLFVWEKGGRVYLCNWNTTSKTYVRQVKEVINIAPEVGDWRDFGLNGFALDPDFDNNGYIYLLYVVDRHYLLYYGTGTYSDNTNEYFNATIGRVTRYKTMTSADGIVADISTRTILLGESKSTGFPILHESHGVGSLAFAADGSLLVTCGDGASYTTQDAGSLSGTYYAQALTDGIIRSNENVGAFRSQMVNSMSGKLLRINPATGDGVPSNPFYNPAAPRSAASRVWAMGFRNPFRMSVKPNTGSLNMMTGDIGEVYIGDVGYNTYEELNIVREGGANCGWPLYEGIKAINAYQSIVTANKDEPNPLYGTGGCTQQYFNFQNLLKQATADNLHTVYNPCNSSVAISSGIDNRFYHNVPSLDWKHGIDSMRVRIFSGNISDIAQIGTAASGVSGTPQRGNCSVGGTWYYGTMFPAQYKDGYFVADYGANWLKHVKMKNASEVASVTTFATGFSGIVDVVENPLDGSLVTVEIGNNTVKKISYGGNQPPVVLFNVDKNFGPGPLTVQFLGSFSYDPEGSVLTYAWDFGDGSPVSTAVSPTHIFTAPDANPKKYVVTLTVKDNLNASASSSSIISVNNTPPVVNITSPVKNSFYRIGPDTLYSLAASVTDAEHTPGQLSYEWQTILKHNNHEHQEPLDTNRTTAAMISRIGCNGDDYHWLIRLKVTDAGGLSTTDYSEIFPTCTNGPLPLVLRTFTVSSADKEHNLVQWVTEMEYNVSYFQLERSQNGINFQPVAKISAVNGTGRNRYEWLDEQPEKGYNFYRLRIVDTDGKAKYSFVIRIYDDNFLPYQLVISPNPVQHQFTLSSQFARRENITIRIIDMNGTVVKNIHEATVSGYNIFEIGDIENLPTGVYTVEIQENGNYRRSRFVKIK